MEEIPSSWFVGGGGIFALWAGLKWILPVLQKTVESATARQNMDRTLHDLHTEVLVKMNELTEELSAAHLRIASLTSKLEVAEDTVRRLTDRLAELEGKK